MSSMEALVREVVRDELHKILPTIRVNEHDPDQMLTTVQVAALTGLSISFFECGRSQGYDLPAHHKIGRRVVYRRADVQAWMQKRREVVGDE